MSRRGAAWPREALVYCSNVHPGESLDAVQGTIGRLVAAVGRARGLARCGAGLWLSAQAARELLASAPALDGFIGELERHRVRLFTLNGFPYGGFHEQVVKAGVYAPDWSTTARLDYTLDLARILAATLPREDEEGTISTLPLGSRTDWSPPRQGQAVANLLRLVRSLHDLRLRSGRRIRVCLEMEPGCVLETTEEAIVLLRDTLPLAATTAGVDPALVAEHLGVCFDVCHQAVMFEDPADSIRRLRAAGIRIGKIQISSAVEAPRPGDPQHRAALAAFDEPRYLHQVRCRRPDGTLDGCADLPEALSGMAALPDAAPWRVHFHVPVQAAGIADSPLLTTRHAIDAVIGLLASEPDVRPHLEVETYTWHVLPAPLRPQDEAGLVAAIATELGWLESRLAEHRLISA